MNTNDLRIPMNKLLYIDDVDHFDGLSNEEMRSLKLEYEPDEIDAIKDSVAWAVDNPDYDFLSLLPIIKFTNKEIYKYLCKLKKA